MTTPATTPPKSPHLTIGIDCGEHTGIAIFDSEAKKITEFTSTDFFGAFKFIKTFRREEVKIFVEIPPTFVYRRNGAQTGAVRDKMCINIGANRREAELLALGLKILDYPVREVPPVPATKWTADQAKRHLGIEKRTNQHVRDAARLAYYYSSTKIPVAVAADK